MDNQEVAGAIAFRLASPETAHLQPAGAPDDIEEGAPWQSSLVLWDETPIRSGVWSCTPGTWRVTYPKLEHFVFLSGRATLTPSSGVPIEIEAGGVCIIPAGWQGTWTVHEKVRKVWLTFQPKQCD